MPSRADALERPWPRASKWYGTSASRSQRPRASTSTSVLKPRGLSSTPVDDGAVEPEEPAPRIRGGPEAGEHGAGEIARRGRGGPPPGTVESLAPAAGHVPGGDDDVGASVEQHARHARRAARAGAGGRRRGTGRSAPCAAAKPAHSAPPSPPDRSPGHRCRSLTGAPARSWTATARGVASSESSTKRISYSVRVVAMARRTRSTSSSIVSTSLRVGITTVTRGTLALVGAASPVGVGSVVGSTVMSTRFVWGRTCTRPVVPNADDGRVAGTWTGPKPSLEPGVNRAVRSRSARWTRYSKSCCGPAWNVPTSGPTRCDPMPGAERRIAGPQDIVGTVADEQVPDLERRRIRDAALEVEVGRDHELVRPGRLEEEREGVLDVGQDRSAPEVLTASKSRATRSYPSSQWGG